MADAGFDDRTDDGRERASKEPDAAPQKSEPPADTVARDNETTATFNHDFGALLSAMEAGVSTEEQEALRALPSGSALLIVRRGPNVGARFLLDADVTTAGRHPDADIFLDDVTVSRKHADFVRVGTKFEVRDLGSLNGTYYNGQRVDSATLVDGGEVQVGKYRLTFYASRLDLTSPAAR
ncbi:FHA domain-containing protein [Ruicaihuangia caeni]|uniref:FHA domain-containing protein n=1 Tax=Ruicaihuangia caeni TaxID=3042517 RepID=UPI0033900D28